MRAIPAALCLMTSLLPLAGPVAGQQAEGISLVGVSDGPVLAVDRVEGRLWYGSGTRLYSTLDGDSPGGGYPRSCAARGDPGPQGRSHPGLGRPGRGRDLRSGHGPAGQSPGPWVAWIPPGSPWPWSCWAICCW
jgi:hypothetical protein